MIIGDDEFKILQKRIAERKASWGDFDRLARFAEFLIEEHKLQAKAITALMDRRRDIVTNGVYVYKAADGGYAVMNRKLNYDANTEQWKEGDIVIHDADAKEPDLLMIVLGSSRDGQLRTKYVSESRKRRVMKNFPDMLHQPERFGIKSEWGKYSQELLKKVQADWERVRRFNHYWPVGTLVRTSNGIANIEACTTTPAYMDDEGNAVVDLEGYLAWSLRLVEAIAEPQYP